ncbi:hypothetical protein V6Z12_A11G206000 [Gossypium hirsutum]
MVLQGQGSLTKAGSLDSLPNFSISVSPPLVDDPPKSLSFQVTVGVGSKSTIIDKSEAICCSLRWTFLVERSSVIQKLIWVGS